MRALLYFQKIKSWLRKPRFVSRENVDETGRLVTTFWFFGLPNGSRAELCEGCDRCSGIPSGFDGGYLNVDLEIRYQKKGLRGLFGEKTSFLLAHPVKMAPAVGVPYYVEEKPKPPVILERPRFLVSTFGTANAFLYFNPKRSRALLVDCGMPFSNEEEHYNNHMHVHCEIPAELARMWHWVDAVIITHPHLDHWNLLQFKPAGIPVYCTPLAKRFLEFQSRFEIGLGFVLNDIRRFLPGESISIGVQRVKTIPIPHSVPEAVALWFCLGEKKVLHLGEFKFHGMNPLEEPELYRQLQKIGKEGLDFLEIDVQNIDTSGFTLSEREVLENLRRFISGTRGRIILTCISSNLDRIRGLSEIGKALDRSIYFQGAGMKRGGEVDHFGKNPPLVFVSGSQAEGGSALWKEAEGFNRLGIGPGDILIFSSRAIPGNEERVKEYINDFQRKGVRVIVNTGEAERLGLVGVEETLTHASGHASFEDVKLALHLLRLRYILPRPLTDANVEKLKQMVGETAQIVAEQNGVLA